MDERLLFVISAPRSGSTLLERMLASHSLVYGRPEPHLLTPLAHLGVFEKVDKAPYDAILAAEAQREFVADLPRGEEDYLDACRAYMNLLYDRMLETAPGKRIFLDKTPAYALSLDFICRVHPKARYVVLTRHPLAVFSSYAESFFDGDYAAAHAYNPILERYVPAIAKFLREKKAPTVHVVYEKLVQDPEAHLREIFEFVGIPHEPGAVDYGKHSHEGKGLGDPIGVQKHSRPTTESVDKWAVEIATNPSRLQLCREMVSRLDPADLETWGHPMQTLWAPLEAAGASGRRPPKKGLTRYRLQRKAIVLLRDWVRHSRVLQKLLKTMRLGADVLLRE